MPSTTISIRVLQDSNIEASEKIFDARTMQF